MPLAMLQVENARTRLPMFCTVISLIVLAVFTALSVISWVLETNQPNPAMQSKQPTMDASDAAPPDPYATESWVRHGREF